MDEPLSARAPAPRCHAHPTAFAGWWCPDCAKRLCVECAVRRPAGGAFVPACRACGVPASPILRFRRMPATGAWVRDVATIAFRDGGWRAFVAAVAAFGALRFMWLPGALLANALLATWLFQLVRTTREGARNLPGFGDFQHFFDDLGRLVRFAGAVLVALVPLAAYHVVRALLWGLGAPPAGGWLEPLAWPFLALGLVWTPWALMLVAIDTPLATALNPVGAWRGVAGTGADGWRTAAGFWVPALGWWWLGRAGSELFPLPNLGTVLVEPIRLPLALAAARAIGLFLRVWAGRIGWGLATDDADPVLGSAQPREVVEVVLREDAPAPPREVVPIELESPGPSPRAEPPPAWLIGVEEAPEPPERAPPAPEPPRALEGELTSEAEFEALVYGKGR